MCSLLRHFILADLHSPQTVNMSVIILLLITYCHKQTCIKRDGSILLCKPNLTQILQVLTGVFECRYEMCIFFLELDISIS